MRSHLAAVALALAAAVAPSPAVAEADPIPAPSPDAEPDPIEEAVQIVTLDQAQRLGAVVRDAKARVDDIIERAGGMSPTGLVDENDFAALQLLLQASSNLNAAGESVDRLTSVLTTPPVNFTLAAYTFTTACSQSAVSRSQVARARLAAIQPPPGLVSPTDPNFPLIVDELRALRSPPPIGVGCP